MFLIKKYLINKRVMIIMPKSEMNKVTEDTLSAGGILLKFYFDMHNKEEDKLQPILVDLINEHLLKERGVVYCYGTIEEPIKIEGLYSTSATVTILFKNIRSAIMVVFNYAPVGIEFIEPTKAIIIKPADVQGMLMDISQTADNYSRYMLQNVLTEEQRTKLSKDISKRVEHGKQMIDDKGSE